MENKELAQQSKLAFDFIHKLYLETSYLVKEIEGLLYEEDEHFVIGKPSGYSVSSRSSTGLESHYINYWLMRSLSVFFVEEDKTKYQKGQTITNLSQDPRVIYLRVIFEDPDIDQPKLQIGVLTDIIAHREVTKKFEQLMAHFTYVERRVFGNLPDVNYEDRYISMKGLLNSLNLFEINSSEAIIDKVIKPTLELYRE